MTEIKKEGVLLKKTSNNFESEGVLNPAVISAPGGIHLFYRAVAPGNHSGVGYCLLSNPLTVAHRMDRLLLFPEFEYESHGIEDPRIVQIEQIYYLTYTAYDGVNALGALATSTDLKHFEKQGLITPRIGYDTFSALAAFSGAVNEKYLRYNQYGHIRKEQHKKIYLWDKNVIFFPRRINGKLYFLHRIRPDIQIAAVTELSDLNTAFWEHYFRHLETHIVLTSKHPHEVSYIGGGCPPIETQYGWLLIYHGVHDTIAGYVYSACAALLDIDNPAIEIARLPHALFKPDADWELKGYVNNVCFPTGTVLEGDRLYIYYGAADEQIACASLSIAELLQELLRHQTMPS